MLLAAKSYVVNAQYPRAMLADGICERMQKPQERIRADGHACLACQVRAAFAAGLHRKGRLQGA